MPFLSELFSKRMPLKRWLFLGMLFSVFISCASTHQTPSSSEKRVDQTVWKRGKFLVKFQAGPSRFPASRSFSYYQINHPLKDGAQSSVKVESALSSSLLGSVNNGLPENHIRVIADPSGSAILIEEDVSNEAGPGSNYIWVTVDEDGDLSTAYLGLPSKDYGGNGGITYGYPKVRSLNAKTLVYTYSDGQAVTANIDEIEKLGRPMEGG